MSATSYALIDGVLLRPLPYRDQDRLAVLWQSDKESPASSWQPRISSTGNASRGRSRTWRRFSSFVREVWRLAGAGDPEQVDGFYVTWNLLDVLGVQRVVGRGFKPRDREAGHNSVVLIRNGFCHSVVWPNYCRLLDIPLLRGRHFDDRGNAAGAPVALNQAGVREAVLRRR